MVNRRHPSPQVRLHAAALLERLPRGTPTFSVEHQCYAKPCENHCPEGSYGRYRDAGFHFHCHPQHFSLEDVKRRMFILHMHTNVWGDCSEQSCLGERGGLSSWCLSLLPSSPLPPVSISLLHHSIFQAAAGVVFIKLSMAPCWLLNKGHFKQEFRGLMIYPRPLTLFFSGLIFHYIHLCIWLSFSLITCMTPKYAGYSLLFTFVRPRMLIISSTNQKSM